MDGALRRELIDALLEVPNMRENEQARTQLLLGLPDRLLETWTRSSDAFTDMQALVVAAEKWGEGALGGLIDNAVHRASGSALARRLEELRTRLGTQGGPPPPRLNAPAPPTPWADRPEFATLKAALLAGGPVALSTAGRGGLGKTALAAKLAWDPEVRAAYPDGVFWVGLGPTPDVLTVLGDLARALGGDVTRYPDEEGRAAVVRSLLANKRCLLVVDDVWQPEIAARLRDLAPAVLCTTRDANVARVFATYQISRLAELSQEASVWLLHELTVEPVNEAVLARVAAPAGGLPLTLGLLAALLDDEARMDWGLDTFLTELENPAWRSEKLSALDTVIGKSIDMLPVKDRTPFVALAVFGPRPATFNVPAAAHVWATDETTARNRLKQFVARYLVDAEGSARFSLHQSVADVITARLTRQYYQYMKSSLRHFEYYWNLHILNQDNLLDIAELEQIRGAWAFFNRRVKPVKPILKAIRPLIFTLPWIRERSLPVMRVIELSEAIPLLISAGVYGQKDEWQEALKYYEQALEVQEEIEQADSLSIIAVLYIRLGEPKQALEYCQRALLLRQAQGDRYGESLIKYVMAVAYRDLDDLPETVRLMEQVVAIDEELGHPDLETNRSILEEARAKLAARSSAPPQE